MMNDNYNNIIIQLVNIYASVIKYKVQNVQIFKDYFDKNIEISRLPSKFDSVRYW